jgi:hypothetical protein
MSSKSRRRMKLAAGAILAGAAIPIAAAGTAWADDIADQDQTETARQLEHQGLTHSEAQAVVTAENNDTPVQVSYDGNTVVNDNQGDTSSTEASAISGPGPHDVAAAVGGGSAANAGNAVGGFPAGNHDTAVATDGAGATADIGNHDTATASGAGSAASSGDGNYDTSTVNGTDSAAGSGGTGTTVGNHDTATVTGDDSQAFAATTGDANSDSHNKAIVKGDGSMAEAGYGYIHDKAEALGNNLTADATDHNGQTVIVRPDDMTPLIDVHSMPMP